MPPGKKRRRAGVSSVSALAFALLLVPASALAASGPPGHGLLSPRLAELAKPSVRSLPPARQARALSLARSGPGSLLRQGSRVLVDVRFDHGAAAGVAGLRAAGAQVVNVSGRYQTVTVAAKPAGLRALARVTGVAGVTEVLTPMTFATCPSGATVSEGDGQLHAAEARSGFGVDGSGVTVGILSDSFNQATQAADGSGLIATHAREDEESGDLPGVRNPCGQTTPVDVLENDLFEPEKEEPADEGRGMAQIVHDLAPGANLAFASAFNGEPAFAASIERLARPASEGGAGAQVIADDVAYFEEPFFQDGPVAAAVNKVSAGGGDYFSSAGNDNLIDSEGHDIASWEAPKFRDSGSCPPALEAIAGLGVEHCMAFDPGTEIDNTFGITVEEGATLTVDLQWAEPWFGVKTDLDAFLLNEAGEPIEVEVEGKASWSAAPKTTSTALRNRSRSSSGKTPAPNRKFSSRSTAVRGNATKPPARRQPLASSSPCLRTAEESRKPSTQPHRQVPNPTSSGRRSSATPALPARSAWGPSATTPPRRRRNSPRGARLRTTSVRSTAHLQPPNWALPKFSSSPKSRRPTAA